MAEPTALLGIKPTFRGYVSFREGIRASGHPGIRASVFACFAIDILSQTQSSIPGAQCWQPARQVLNRRETWNPKVLNMETPEDHGFHFFSGLYMFNFRFPLQLCRHFMSNFISCLFDKAMGKLTKTDANILFFRCNSKRQLEKFATLFFVLILKLSIGKIWDANKFGEGFLLKCNENGENWAGGGVIFIQMTPPKFNKHRR